MLFAFENRVDALFILEINLKKSLDALQLFSEKVDYCKEPFTDRNSCRKS